MRLHLAVLASKVALCAAAWWFTTAAVADIPPLAWARGMGGTGADGVEAVAVDAAGNVYATGVVSAAGGVFGEIAGLPVVLPPASNSDIFITKHTRDGSLAWAHRVGGRASDSGLGIAVDAAANVYVTGYFSGSGDFDPGPGVFTLETLGSNFEAFLLKLDTNGAFVWAKAIGQFGADRGTRVAVDPAGDVVLAGVFSGEANFNPGGLVPFNLTSRGNEDVFVAKYTADGVFRWAGAWGSTAVDWVNGLAIDAAGNIYTAGRFAFTVDFDPGPGVFELTSTLSNNAFISKLDKDGRLVWARAIEPAEALDVAVAPDGSVYAAGIFVVTRDFDPDPDAAFLMTSAGGNDGFLLKLTAGGAFAWARRFGSFRNDAAHRVVVDAGGAVYLAGEFDTGLGTSFPADFGPLEVLTAGGVDTVVAKVTAEGDFEWVLPLGGPSNDVPRDLVIDTHGTLYLGGSFLLTANFDPAGGMAGQLTSAGNRDGYLVVLGEGGPARVPGDVDGDGVVNAVDVQLGINAALGISISPGFNADINGDGVVNAVDVQLVINAALGILIAV